jgi:transposase InsO family protein
MNLTDQRLHTSWQQKAYTKLLGLQFKICYKKGIHNGAADALSRCDHGEPLEAVAISICKPTWLEEVAKGYLHDAKSAKLLAQLSTPYKLKDGLIRYKGRIWLGYNSALQNKIFGALHDSFIGGHSGFPVTYRRIKTLFAWPGMKKRIKLKVKECSICQQAKPDRFRYPGLLQPLPVPSGAWQTVTMDFIEGLPKSRRFNCIMVVVDKLSRYAHFLPLAHPFSAADVAQLYMEGVFKLHGLPLAVVSDRDKIFTSNFWEQLFQSVGTKLHMSSAYHPQTDGQTERVNQCLETYLCCFTHSCPSKWSTWLYLAEYWYNTTYHSTLEQTPFEVLCGHTPN